jgi:hypothetical protein
MDDYWETVRRTATTLNSDGCTGVPDLYLDCCYQHDIHYRTHRTLDGQPITKREADRLFRECMQSHSRLGWWAPLSWVRWAAVALLGKCSWDDHDEERNHA